MTPDYSSEAWDAIVQAGGTPTFRVYVHDVCGSGTVVTDGHYTWLTDPFLHCDGTYCAGCKGPVHLGDVYWPDTGENLLDYRRRLRRLTPLWLAALRGWLGALPGFVLGGVVTYLACTAYGLPTDRAAAGAFSGALVGAVVVAAVVSRAVRAIWGPDFRRVR